MFQIIGIIFSSLLLLTACQGGGGNDGGAQVEAQALKAETIELQRRRRAGDQTVDKQIKVNQLKLRILYNSTDTTQEDEARLQGNSVFDTTQESEPRSKKNNVFCDTAIEIEGEVRTKESKVFVGATQEDEVRAKGGAVFGATARAKLVRSDEFITDREKLVSLVQRLSHSSTDEEIALAESLWAELQAMPAGKAWKKADGGEVLSHRPGGHSTLATFPTNCIQSSAPRSKRPVN